MFITYGDNTLHLPDFSEKSGPYHNSRIPWIKSRRGSDSETPKGISDMKENTSKGETPRPTHSWAKCLDTCKQESARYAQTRPMTSVWVLPGNLSSQQLELQQVSTFLEVNTDQLFPSLRKLCYSSQLGNSMVFQGWLQHSSESQTRRSSWVLPPLSGVGFSISRRTHENTAQFCFLWRWQIQF